MSRLASAKLLVLPGFVFECQIVDAFNTFFLPCHGILSLASKCLFGGDAYNFSMRKENVNSMLEAVELILSSSGSLSPEIQTAIEGLLNIVEILTQENKSLKDEVERLGKLLDEKKKAKTTTGDKAKTSDHSSEHRRKRRSPTQRRAPDRRSFKALTIHQEVECPVDPSKLPPDAVRLGNESVDVQDIVINPHNIRFLQHVYYSAKKKKYFRGSLPHGYDVGDFGADLRSLILSLKYCGNMSEPKIREFLENFDVEISAGSVSNILTKTANHFEQEFDDLVLAGLNSTAYQQTDDTSARVAGEFWHTHVLCNPYYAAYFTKRTRDRFAVLEVLQNSQDSRFLLNQSTRDLLRSDFIVPEKWHRRLEELGDVQYDQSSMDQLLDDWFKTGNRQLRVSIAHAAAIIYYREQNLVPVIQTLVCDDAPQFKLLTDKLALCWIHEGRHYERLTPVVQRHAEMLETFVERFWDYYSSLQDYRAGPSEDRAAELRREFDELISTRTGYMALDDRIATTAGNKRDLLTVLSMPTVPLHNNASELLARVSARRRDVSLHSKSVRGARSMDIFTSIVQTCKKLRVSAYDYLRDRLQCQNQLPALAEMIGEASQTQKINVC
jgi:hypothetical protein